jgi:hypothetical protein
MSSTTATAFIFAGLCVAYLAVIPRSVRKMRLGDQEWRRQWRALSPGRRKALLATMRRGEAVRDPDDAALALRGVAQLDYIRGAMRPVKLAGTATLIAVVIVGILSDQPIYAFIGGAGLIASGLLSVIARWRHQRLQRCADATRRLLQTRH